MFKIDKDGLARDTNGTLVAVPIDSTVTAMGIETESSLIILRLYQQAWQDGGSELPTNRLHQFALPAHRAAALGRQLLELAAQAEKEAGKTAH